MGKIEVMDLTPSDDRPPAPPPGDVLDDPATAPDDVNAPYDPVEAFVPMTEAEVADKLDMVGEFLGMVLPDAGIEDLWELTAHEVESLAPPLARVLNKRPQVVQVVQRSDEVVVAFYVGKYALDRVGELRSAAAEDDNPEVVDVSEEVFPNA